VQTFSLDYDDQTRMYPMRSAATRGRGSAVSFDLDRLARGD